MKLFLDQNYYEVLDVLPSATPFEIRHAYKKIHQMYQEDSLASYSFFTGEERKRVLETLDKVFHTLMNEESRTRYDQSLIELGKLDETMQYREFRKRPTPIFDFSHARGSRRDVRTHAAPEEMPVCREILDKEVLTGADLKRIRTEMGVAIEFISAQTKVRAGLLRCIEEDQHDQLPSRFHLQKYLTFYAECLHLDSARVVELYMKRIEPESLPA